MTHLIEALALLGLATLLVWLAAFVRVHSRHRNIRRNAWDERRFDERDEIAAFYRRMNGRGK